MAYEDRIELRPEDAKLLEQQGMEAANGFVRPVNGRTEEPWAPTNYNPPPRYSVPPYSWDED